MAAPTGGEKDTIPPEVRKSVPPNYSILFDENSIEIVFNEYIQLRDVNQKLIVSPPLADRPEIRLKGKSIIIKIDQVLKENTTYTFNFSDAIVDNNEGNPLENFEFVFSTGSSLDSLYVEGIISDAFTRKPVEGAYVMLYSNLEDSAPMTEKPLYVSKTNKEGGYKINNLRQDTFRVFTLVDLNTNYIFDQPSEAIGFADSLVPVRLEMIQVPDTTRDDSSFLKSFAYRAQRIELVTFLEEQLKRQYLLNTERPQKELLRVVFNKPLPQAPEIVIPDYRNQEGLYLEEVSRNIDTINYWLRDTSLIKQEAIEIFISYMGENAEGHDQEQSDTINFRFITEKGKSRVGRGVVEEKKSLNIIPGIRQGSNLDLNGSIKINSPTPVSLVDTSLIRIYKTIDSTEFTQPFYVVTDSGDMRVKSIQGKWEEALPYRLEILPAAFTDYLGQQNDSIDITFKTRGLEYYGNLFLQVSGVDSSVIVQFLNQKGEVVREDLLGDNTLLEYRYLHPRKYSIRAIEDVNKNNRWDPGHYLSGRQPEKVIYFSEEIEIRSNWDVELSWVLDFK